MLCVLHRLSTFDISKMTVSLGIHTIGNGVDYGNDAQMTRRVSRAAIHNGYNEATFVSIKFSVFLLFIVLIRLNLFLSYGFITRSLISPS